MISLPRRMTFKFNGQTRVPYLISLVIFMYKIHWRQPRCWVRPHQRDSNTNEKWFAPLPGLACTACLVKFSGCKVQIHVLHFSGRTAAAPGMHISAGCKGIYSRELRYSLTYRVSSGNPRTGDFPGQSDTVFCEWACIFYFWYQQVSDTAVMDHTKQLWLSSICCCPWIWVRAFNESPDVECEQGNGEWMSTDHKTDTDANLSKKNRDWRSAHKFMEYDTSCYCSPLQYDKFGTCKKTGILTRCRSPLNDVSTLHSTLKFCCG